MSLLSALTSGFLLGLALSPTCLGACLPVLLPYFGSDPRAAVNHTKAFMQFLLGRLGGYLIMGLAAGWLGGALQNSLAVWGGALYAVTGALLLVYAVAKIFPELPWCGWLHRGLGRGRASWWLGLLTGLNICPPFISALAQATQAGGPVSGMAVMAAFFAGTSLILLPLPLMGRWGDWEIWRFASRIACGVIGLGMMIKGLLMFMR